jgi:hypothetical protein
MKGFLLDVVWSRARILPRVLCCTVLSTRELTDRWVVRLGDQSLEPRWYSAAGVPAVDKRAAESVNYSDEGRSRGRSLD